MVAVFIRNTPLGINFPSLQNTFRINHKFVFIKMIKKYVSHGNIKKQDAKFSASLDMPPKALQSTVQEKTIIYRLVATIIQSVGMMLFTLRSTLIHP